MSNKPKCFLTIGVSASGKTTWADKQQLFIVCRDNNRRYAVTDQHIYLYINGDWNLWQYYDFKKMEKKSAASWEFDLDFAIATGEDFIIADTNLNPKYRLPLIDKLEKSGHDVVLQEFHVDFDEAVKRDKRRRDSVGFHVIYKQWRQWQDYLASRGYRKKYVPNTDLPSAIIVDIDGTVAEMVDRGPFEWNKVGQDKPRKHVINIVESLHKASQGYNIVFLSGRDSVCYNETWEWLQDNVALDLNKTVLFMRAKNDMRKDSIIKEELFWRNVAPFYNVEMVIDDRPQVCRMWKDVGLNVVNVGDPFIEF